MTKQIILEEALQLVSFYHDIGCGWGVRAVHGDINGAINGDVCGDIKGTVDGNIVGNVRGTINGRGWEFIETPKEKLQRLITESGNQELIDTFNQMEEN
mgnify:CR=1 FL=1